MNLQYTSSDFSDCHLQRARMVESRHPAAFSLHPSVILKECVEILLALLALMKVNSEFFRTFLTKPPLMHSRFSSTKSGVFALSASFIGNVSSSSFRALAAHSLSCPRKSSQIGLLPQVAPCGSFLLSGGVTLHKHLLACPRAVVSMATCR